jgi:hypothetical protein
MFANSNNKPIFPAQSAAAKQAGFSMVIVFLIMISMVGASTMVLVSTRSNVRNAGMQREKMVSRYVAEAAIAEAKSIMLTKWNSISRWSTLITSPPVQANVYRDYTYGGINGLPLVKSRLMFSFINNLDDPSKNILIDNDGKVIIRGRGEILDPGSLNPIVLAVTVIEVAVFKEDVTVDTVGYSAQSHGNSSQTSSTNMDSKGVNFGTSVIF